MPVWNSVSSSVAQWARYAPANGVARMVGAGLDQRRQGHGQHGQRHQHFEQGKPRCRSNCGVIRTSAPLQGHLYLGAVRSRHPQGNDHRRHLAGIAQPDMRFPATGGASGVLAIQLQLDLDQILWETARPQLRVLRCMPLRVLSSSTMSSRNCSHRAPQRRSGRGNQQFVAPVAGYGQAEQFHCAAVVRRHRRWTATPDQPQRRSAP